MLKEKYLKNFSLNILGLVWLISCIVYYFILCFLPIQNVQRNPCFILMSVLITFLITFSFFVSAIVIIHNIKKFGGIGSSYMSIFISVCILIIIVTFAITYRLIDIIDYNGFKYNSEMNNAFDTLVNWLYFSVITFTSLGYGDIVPVSNVAKIFVSIEAMTFTVFISFIIMNFTKSNENKKNLKNKEDIYMDSKNMQDRNNITINIESNNSTITTTINITDLLKPELKGNKEKETEQNEENNNE